MTANRPAAHRSEFRPQRIGSTATRGGSDTTPLEGEEEQGWAASVWAALQPHRSPGPKLVDALLRGVLRIGAPAGDSRRSNESHQMNTRRPQGIACTCVQCGALFEAWTKQTRFCSAACRRLNNRARKVLEPVATVKELEVRVWEGTPIQRRADGYVNATAMCKANGKHLPHYMANERTKQYLQALSPVVGIPTTDLVQAIQGGQPDLQGTWIHPRLAVDLARWISPAFAVWMDGWFLEELQGGRVSHVQDTQPAVEPTPAALPVFQMELPVGTATKVSDLSWITTHLQTLVCAQFRSHEQERQHLIADACVTLLLNLYRPRPLPELTEQMRLSAAEVERTFKPSYWGQVHSL